MSVIIATRMPDGRLFVAADSRTVRGYDKFKVDGDCAKLQKRDDGLIFGSVGSMADGQALFYDEDFLPTKDLRDLSVGYLVNQHIYIVNRLLDFHGYTGPITNETCRLDSQFSEGRFMVVYNGDAYSLDGDGCVTTLNEEDEYDFLAIGSGEPYVSSYLKAHLKEAKTPEDTKRIVTEAIKATSQCTWTIDDKVVSYVSEPTFNVTLDIDTAKAIMNKVDETMNDTPEKIETERAPEDGSTPKVKAIKGRRPRRKKN